MHTFLLREIIPASLLFFLLLLNPLFAFAAVGGSDGGDGHAVLCYKDKSIKLKVEEKLKKKKANELSKEEIETFEEEVDLELSKLSGPPQMLDIFEVKPTDIDGNLKTPNIAINIQTLNNKISDEIGGSYSQYFEPFMSEVTSWQHFQSGITEINQTDAVQRLPQNCLAVQIGFFDDSNNSISYDERIYELMDDANKTAFTLHEDIYKMWRHHTVYNTIFIKTNEVLSDSNGPDNSMFRDELIKSYGLNNKTSRVIRPIVRYLMSAKTFKTNQFKPFADKIWVYLEVLTIQGKMESEPIVFELKDAVSGKVIGSANYLYIPWHPRLLKPWNFVPY